MFGRTRCCALRLSQGLHVGQVSAPTVHRLVLRELLNPRQWRAPEDRKFHLDAEQINELCDAAERIFKDEPSVLRLRGESMEACCCNTAAAGWRWSARWLLGAVCHEGVLSHYACATQLRSKSLATCTGSLAI
jgi:hypothetical protein